MTKLISNYARATGLQIDPKGPNIKEVFISLPLEKYITIQTGSGQAPKCYDLWPEVLALLSPMLRANNIHIVHIGAKDDPALPGVYDLRGQTNYFQANYLIKRSLLHMGNDSWLAHCAGWNRRPLVALYGSTSSQNHGPYWADWTKTILIDAHRSGGVPTYSSNELPKTINTIDPYRVANEVLRLLGIKDEYTQRARFWGILYQHTIIDMVPDAGLAPGFLPQTVVNIRMDYSHNEEILQQILQTGRKVNIVTSRPINHNLIAAFKGQILSYNHELGAPEIDLPSAEYVTTIKSIVRQTAFFTRETDVTKLSIIRLAYFPDICMVEQIRDTTKQDYINASLLYQNKEDTPENRLDIEKELSYSRFRTNKYLLSNGSVYLSHAHQRTNQSITDLATNTGQVVDNELFFKDLNHYSIWYEPSPITPAVN